MSHTQHTPGPWVVCMEDDGDAAVTIFAASQLRDGRIAADEWDDCIALAGLNHNESEANARLIAAAPELYEVAEALFKAIDNYLITNTGDEDSVGVLLDCASAALSKARGES